MGNLILLSSFSYSPGSGLVNIFAGLTSRLFRSSLIPHSLLMTAVMGLLVGRLFLRHDNSIAHRQHYCERVRFQTLPFTKIPANLPPDVCL